MVKKKRISLIDKLLLPKKEKKRKRREKIIREKKITIKQIGEMFRKRKIITKERIARRKI